MGCNCCDQLIGRWRIMSKLQRVRIIWAAVGTLVCLAVTIANIVFFAVAIAHTWFTNCHSCIGYGGTKHCYRCCFNCDSQTATQFFVLRFYAIVFGIAGTLAELRLHCCFSGLCRLWAFYSIRGVFYVLVGVLTADLGSTTDLTQWAQVSVIFGYALAGLGAANILAGIFFCDIRQLRRISQHQEERLARWQRMVHMCGRDPQAMIVLRRRRILFEMNSDSDACSVDEAVVHVGDDGGAILMPLTPRGGGSLPPTAAGPMLFPGCGPAPPVSTCGGSSSHNRPTYSLPPSLLMSPAPSGQCAARAPSPGGAAFGVLPPPPPPPPTVHVVPGPPLPTVITKPQTASAEPSLTITATAKQTVTVTRSTAPTTTTGGDANVVPDGRAAGSSSSPSLASYRQQRNAPPGSSGDDFKSGTSVGGRSRSGARDLRTPIRGRNSATASEVDGHSSDRWNRQIRVTRTVIRQDGTRVEVQKDDLLAPQPSGHHALGERVRGRRRSEESDGLGRYPDSTSSALRAASVGDSSYERPSRHRSRRVATETRTPGEASLEVTVRSVSSAPPPRPPIYPSVLPTGLADAAAVASPIQQPPEVVARFMPPPAVGKRPTPATAGARNPLDKVTVPSSTRSAHTTTRELTGSNAHGTDEGGAPHMTGVVDDNDDEAAARLRRQRRLALRRERAMGPASAEGSADQYHALGSATTTTVANTRRRHTEALSVAIRNAVESQWRRSHESSDSGG